MFLNGTGDHLRTRLTHTMEVAAISRNIARALRLNEDLTETIALAHDLGHPPFGHKGEEVLNRLMKRHGGFEHNRQSLRIVELLEQKYPTFSGLNLTWETREGLIKHHTNYDHPIPRPDFDAKSSSLEAQVANVADEVAYYSHDLDDGLSCGLLSERQLTKKVRVWRQAERVVKAEFGDLSNECRHYFTIRSLIDWGVRDVVQTTEIAVRESGVRSADEVRSLPYRLVQYSPPLHEQFLELRDFLYSNLYYNPVVHRPNQEAGERLESLFAYFLARPTEIGDQAQRVASHDGWPRAICDYIAGMTDRYANQQHERLMKARQ